MAKSTVSELKQLAQKYRLQGKRLLAAETYQKIMLEEPSNPRWPQKAGEEYRTIGRKDRAIGMFQAAAGLNAHQGFTLKAITLCKLVLELDTSNQAAQRLLDSFSAAAPPEPPAILEPIGWPEVAKPEPGPQQEAAQQQPPARTLPETVDWPELAQLDTKEDPAEAVEQIEAADLDELLAQAKPPQAHPGPVSFSIPPGETLAAVDLGHALALVDASPQPDGEAVEILIDEPETTPAPAPASTAAAVPAQDEILTRLQPVPIFSFLGKSALRALVERAEVRTYPPGARLITQGETGHSLYVLVEGEVAVFHEGPPRVELRRLGEGSFFGEIALVTRIPRTATVAAVRESQVLKISREVFNELVECYPDMVTVILRYLRERLVQGLVETHSLFAPFAGSERKKLVRRFSLLEAPRGCVLAEEGVHARAMYIMLCGEAESSRGSVPLTGLTTGDLVGVESLLTSQPSLVSVKTLTKCWILKLREETFREVILTHSPVLATLSDMIRDQRRNMAAVVAGEAFEPLGIPLY